MNEKTLNKYYYKISHKEGLKVFIQICNALAEQDEEFNIDQAVLVEELQRLMFTNDDIRLLTEYALTNGVIFERKSGVLCKA